MSNWLYSETNDINVTGVRSSRDLPSVSIPDPLRDLFASLARPWTLHIVWTLSTEGPQRFGKLRRTIGKISARVLAERLRSLEDKGLVYRHYKQTIPPEVTYGLTKPYEGIGVAFRHLERLLRERPPQRIR